MVADIDVRDGRVSYNDHGSGPVRGEAVGPLGASCDRARRVIHDGNDNVHVVLAS